MKFLKELEETFFKKFPRIRVLYYFTVWRLIFFEVVFSNGS